MKPANNKHKIPNSEAKPDRTQVRGGWCLKIHWCLGFGLWCLAFPAQAVLFRLPLASNTTTHYYYDHGSTTDWKCGNETYSGHRGTDFSGGPRGKAIYAGAVGTLHSKIDGFGDGSWGSTDGGGFGNHVRVSHSGGFLSIYAHMTAGSVTSKSTGSAIACGEQIGGVGTSGNSTGLHLHFEVRVNNVADDPYQGACGGPLTYWVNQNNGNPVTTCEGAGGTDGATFVSENYPDGSVLSPGQGFTKQFVLKNSGTTTWTANGTNGYTLKHTSDSPTSPNLGAALHTVLSNNVAAGVNYTFNLPLIAPTTPGTYQANFKMKNSSGAEFGDPVWANIVVQIPPAPPAPTALAATSITSGGFNANWTSANGATGYRLDVSTNVTFSSFVSGYQNLDVGNVTNRMVSGLTAGRAYYYRLRAYNAGGNSTNSGVVTATTIAASPCFAILDSGFEGGFTLAGGGNIANQWTEWEAEPGVVVGYDETGVTHGGGHSQRLRVWGGAGGTSGGVYQRIPVSAGIPFSISVWMFADDTMTACSLGVDPAGGTNAASGVFWSSPSTNVAWVQRTLTGTTLADYLTVYLRVTSSDSNKRNGYFDDAEPGAKPLQLQVQRSGNGLTLGWPECPGASLQQATNLTTPTWTAVTNQATVAGGQKTISLTPAGSAGYFRLIQD